ncbi:MAG: hypothetical protein LUI13_02350 [Lachnospiraceae bacterium]|nr:hypothetical protein [Lachnospiraceae bacterium]
MTDGYEPVIHWITRQENYEIQEMLTVRESRSTHADPTAYAAIGRVDRDSKWKRRKNSWRKPRCQPRTRVWQQEDAGMDLPGLPEIEGKENHDTTEFL